MGVLGVIGGSGFSDLAELGFHDIVNIDTPFGKPSGPVVRGTLGATEFLFLSRHGTGHTYSPAEVPYRANIYALKKLGATHLLSLSAVGSLRNDLPPRTLVVPDQIIDRTGQRERTFFDRGIVVHVGLADPFCPLMQDALIRSGCATKRSLHRGGTYVCIEGPQFSTRAESNLYRSWGAAVIGMTAMPEARLAREAELCYATLALVTDYDVWHESEADVSLDVVLSHLDANARAAREILEALARVGMPERSCPCDSTLSSAVVTSRDALTTEARQRVDLFVGDRLNGG